MNHRSQFFQATDQTAFTAIRSKIDGTSMEIAGIGAPEADQTMDMGADLTLDVGPGGMG